MNYGLDRLWIGSFNDFALVYFPQKGICKNLSVQGYLSVYLITARHIRLTCWRLHAGGGSQRFGRAMYLQIRTKLSAGIHPRLRETAR